MELIRWVVCMIVWKGLIGVRLEEPFLMHRLAADNWRCRRLVRVDFSRRGVVLYSKADAADEDIRLYARVDDAAVSVQATEPSTAGGRLTPLAMTMMQHSRPGVGRSKVEEWVCTPRATPPTKADDPVRR